jgi:hypothetical protein
MAELTNMAMTAAERKAQSGPTLATAAAEPGPRYPWGLTLTLDDDALDKLGIDTLPTVATAQMLVARVEVTRTSSDVGDDKKKRQSLSLQITDCCLEPEAARETIKDALYGEKKD